MKNKWKDTTSYSQGDKERIPKTWELPVKDLGRIIVTRWRDGEPDFWYLTCHELNIKYRPLKGFKIEDAQDEALHFIFRHLSKCLTSLENIVND